MPEPVRDIVELAIGGEVHRGWTSVTIDRGIDTLCGRFTLGLASRWTGRADAFPIEAGAAVELSVSGERLMTGWIDQLLPVLTAEDRSITVVGRDKPCDLEDCSAEARPGSWVDTPLEAIAAALAKPFGIEVSARAPTGAPIRKFSLQPGESVQAAIERLCRFRGLLAVSTPTGAVELIVPTTDGGAVESIVQGRDFTQATAAHDMTERYSEYIAKGQSSGDDQVNGRAAASPSARANDAGVGRYRPLIVMAEDQADPAGLEKRARWEASSRAGRAQPASVTLPGWRRRDGALRVPNTIVDFEAPALFMRGPMLVERVTLTKGESGTESVLNLVPPHAWSQLAIPEDSRPSRLGEP